MNTISFMSANFVARQLDYHMTGGWSQGDKATNEYFRPESTFGERLETMLAEVRELGFKAIDIWLAHLHPDWATPAHISKARHLLKEYDLIVASLAGGFGDTPESFEAACRLAVQLGTRVLGGNTNLLVRNRPFVVSTLKRYGVKLGLENHPEKNTTELLQKVGDGGDGTIGVAVDTGWFATHGFDAAVAIEEAGDLLFHVHLKDVLVPGAHETCRLGQGCLPLEDCLAALKQIGYRGVISIEHEPENFDPREECRESLEIVRDWLSRE